MHVEGALRILGITVSADRTVPVQGRERGRLVFRISVTEEGTESDIKLIILTSQFITTGDISHNDLQEITEYEKYLLDLIEIRRMYPL